MRASLYLEFRMLLKIAVDECRYWRASAAFQQRPPGVLPTNTTHYKSDTLDVRL